MKVIKEKNHFCCCRISCWRPFQKRIGDSFGVKPGAEMIAAVDAAEAVGAEVCLADRTYYGHPVPTWRSTGFFSKMKLLFQPCLHGRGRGDDEKDIEAMKQADMLESILSEVEKSHPVLREILIDERDRYLAQKIKTAPGQKIVAIVGAGHEPGIRKYIHTDSDLAALETLPPKSRFSGMFKWLIPALIVGLIVYGFFQGGAAAGKDMIVWWVGANAVFAGIGAIVAFGHPFTVLSAIFAAPITSLNPMIAAGWVSGLVEAFSRKPKVRDLESLPEDILSARGFWRNKVTRILLVVVFTNLGSSIGTFVALPLMMKALGG
ncbi:MAG: TraB/GumN family protein [Desulfobacterales bacterium]